MRRRFSTLDVFTAERFAGNPLAVVHDADGLDGDAMQAIAREFNLSETVFILPAAGARGGAKVRIFTPAAELPFAGHPTVGTAVLLALEGHGEEIVLEEGIGPVACRATAAGPAVGHADFVLPRLPRHIGDLGDAADIAAALNLALDDLGCDDFEPGLWSAGVEFAFVPVRGLDAAQRARPDAAQWERAFGPKLRSGAFLFCRETAREGHDFHARMFAPGMGIAEDPATGAAVAAFAGLLARTLAEDGARSFVIEQGFEMGRPSLITLTLHMSAGALSSATIGGDAVLVSEGTIEA